LSTALKVEAASSSETSVTNYKSTRRPILESFNLRKIASAKWRIASAERDLLFSVFVHMRWNCISCRESWHLRRLGAVLLRRGLCFNPRWLRVWFVWDKVALEHCCLFFFAVFLLIIIPQICPY